MTNPSLQQEQQAELYELINNFKSEFDPYFYEEDWDSLLAFIHKVIAERDEALRKKIEEMKKSPYTSGKIKPAPDNLDQEYGYEVAISDILSLLSKE